LFSCLTIGPGHFLQPRAGILLRQSHIRPVWGRYASYPHPEFIARLFRTVNPPPNLKPTWNMAPTDDAPVVRLAATATASHLDLLKWGLVPYFTKDLKKERKPINDRSETVATSGIFKAAFAKRFWLVPAPGYYEWRDDPEGKALSGWGRNCTPSTITTAPHRQL
jgi:putative SOS response-associated peptidase YedK